LFWRAFPLLKSFPSSQCVFNAYPIPFALSSFFFSALAFTILTPSGVSVFFSCFDFPQSFYFPVITICSQPFALLTRDGPYWLFKEFFAFLSLQPIRRDRPVLQIER